MSTSNPSQAAGVAKDMTCPHCHRALSLKEAIIIPSVKGPVNITALASSLCAALNECKNSADALNSSLAAAKLDAAGPRYFANGRANRGGVIRSGLPMAELNRVLDVIFP